MKLSKKLEKRFGQLNNAGFDGFQSRLEDFWEFFDNETILIEVRENLLSDFPEISQKVKLMRGTSVKVELKTEKEKIAFACEVLRDISTSDSFRGNMHAFCHPAVFSYVNCKNQPEIDENYLRIFKQLYLERFQNYLEEKIEEFEMENNGEENLIKRTEPTITQNFHAPVGAVQTGNYNSANINQNIGQNFSEILEHLAKLKREFQLLPDGDREEAIEVVDALEVEVVKDNPSKGKVKAFLSSVKDFAIKTGTDVTSKIVVELIKDQMGIKS